MKEMLLQRITPTPSDLIKSSEEHYKTYNNTRKQSASHLMVLFYAVECRLKANYYKLVKKEIKKKGKNSAPYKLLTTHDLEELAKKLNYELRTQIIKVGTCPKAKSKQKSERDKSVEFDIKDVHLCWRYGIDIEPNSEDLIVEWLKKVHSHLEKRGIKK